MANELRLSALLVHHTTKITVENANNVSPFDTIRGSSAIRAVCRGSWVIAASDRTYRLCVEHGFGEKQDLEVLLDLETLTWRSVRPWNPKSCATQVDQILVYLKKVSCATIPEIASVLNLNPNYVTTALWRLQTDNSVQKEPGKKYHPAIYHYTEQSLAIIETKKNEATIKPVDNGLHTNSSMVCNLVCNHNSNTATVLDPSTSLHTIDATFPGKKAQKVSPDLKLIPEPFPSRENGMLCSLESKSLT